MTWKEFKDYVESQGVRDEDGIWCIDTGSYPSIPKKEGGYGLTVTMGKDKMEPGRWVEIYS